MVCIDPLNVQGPACTLVGYKGTQLINRICLLPGALKKKLDVLLPGDGSKQARNTTNTK